MSIEARGQYFFKFSLGDKTDFINEDDFNGLTVIEEAGNLLPTFEISFATNDETILPLLNEGNSLLVTMGKDIASLKDIPISMTSIATSAAGGKMNIHATGIYSAIPYMVNSKLLITEPLSSVEVMKNLVKGVFKFDSNIDKSSDVQRWVQYNISDRKLISEMWLHSHIPKSFLALGISTDGRFIVRDVAKDLESNFRWRFTNSGKEENDIEIEGDLAFQTNTGLVNAWAGYAREKLVYTMEAGSEECSKDQVEPIMAMTSKMGRVGGDITRFSSSAMINDNTHENYWKAHIKNISSLSSFNNVIGTATFTNRFVPIRVLDLVMLQDEDLKINGLSSQQKSGLFYVGRVARTLSKRSFSTTVKLCRESLNLTQTGL